MGINWDNIPFNISNNAMVYYSNMTKLSRVINMFRSYKILGD